MPERTLHDRVIMQVHGISFMFDGILLFEEMIQIGSTSLQK